MENLFLGVDPGWTNLGWALSNEKGELLMSGTLCPKELGHGNTAIHLLKFLESEGYPIAAVKGLGMERFVYYKGVHNPDSENILMVTGEFTSQSSLHAIRVNLFRAIDWKKALAKHLWLSCAFRNPSESFDKKFSFAAALCIYKVTFKVDHEADAGCLSYLAREAWERSCRSPNTKV